MSKVEELGCLIVKVAGPETRNALFSKRNVKPF
jgi:hypothetical protein